MIETRLLRQFAAVAEELHFHKAARCKRTLQVRDHCRARELRDWRTCSGSPFDQEGLLSFIGGQLNTIGATHYPDLILDCAWWQLRSVYLIKL